MKFRYLAASAALALSALTATQASAQSVTGTVNLHGTVAPRCGSTFNGDTTFAGTINLGELTGSNGAILPGLATSNSNSPAGVADFFVGCSSIRFNVTMSATRLVNPASVPAPPGSATMDYTAESKIALAEGGFAFATYTTAATLPTPSVTLVNGAVSAVAGNFQVRVYGLHPDNGDASIMLAGAYDSVISILVAPAP
ncbi:MAG: hypothetical protein WC804_12925 [Sphingomonas sp.]|jgi:hypothetical protein|uniref:hypothetical protein n=1 Tax=Sphingomonas sp. TaxID=28214 RepID=UPI0035630835